MNYSKYYKSSSYYGSDKIIKKYLKLNINKNLPIVIPHGVDYFQHENYILDSSCLEPIYLCLRDDIYNKVKKTNRIPIKFPHPWIFILNENKVKKGSGTIFVAPPCSHKQYQYFYDKINLKKFRKPWKAIIKHRGAKKEHFEWWKRKGIHPLTAGDMKNPFFYNNLFKILNDSQDVILCNMSSAGIFAASMGKKVRFVENFYLTDLETNEVEFPKLKSKNYQKVKKTWKNILSRNKFVSKKTALFLLGAKYLNKKKLMKKILIQSIEKSENYPIYFTNLNKFFYKLILKLSNFNENFIKLLPNPYQKIKKKMAEILRLQTININTINDFGYYGLGGKFSYPEKKKINTYKLKKPEPGHVPKAKKKYKNLFNI